MMKTAFLMAICFGASMAAAQDTGTISIMRHGNWAALHEHRVTVDGETRVLHGDSVVEYKLQPGEYTATVSVHGMSFPRKFLIKAGDERCIDVRAFAVSPFSLYASRELLLVDDAMCPELLSRFKK